QGARRGSCGPPSLHRLFLADRLGAGKDTLEHRHQRGALQQDALRGPREELVLPRWGDARDRCVARAGEYCAGPLQLRHMSVLVVVAFLGIEPELVSVEVV